MSHPLPPVAQHGHPPPPHNDRFERGRGCVQPDTLRLSVGGGEVCVSVGGAGQADSALLPSSCCLLRWCENEARGCLTAVCVGVGGQ